MLLQLLLFVLPLVSMLIHMRMQILVLRLILAAAVAAAGVAASRTTLVFSCSSAGMLGTSSSAEGSSTGTKAGC